MERAKRERIAALKREQAAAYRTVIEDPITVLRVNSAYRTGRLSLFLGAGVSSALRLPLWDTLVDQLAVEVYQELGRSDHSEVTKRARMLGFANTMMIRHLENVLPEATDFRRRIQGKLYQTFHEDGVAALIGPICDHFLSGPQPVRHVVTYNFDNALERCLKRRGRPTFSVVHSSRSYPANMDSDIHIYHPHGFIPHPEDDPVGVVAEEPVVFSERDYHHHFMDPGHWANVMQLQHLMHRTVLFIGVSLADPNMRRLLDQAKSRTEGGVRHVAIQKDKGDLDLNFMMEADHRSLGVAPLWVSRFEDIPTLFAELARSDAAAG